MLALVFEIPRYRNYDNDNDDDDDKDDDDDDNTFTYASGGQLDRDSLVFHLGRTD